MKLKLTIDPDIVAMMQAEIAAGERAVTTAMREAGAGLKSAWRGQITGALYSGTGGDFDIHVHLGSQHVSQGGFSQHGRSVKQDMVQRLAAFARGSDQDRQVFACSASCPACLLPGAGNGARITDHDTGR